MDLTKEGKMTPATSLSSVIAVDVGGTKIEAAVVTADGTVMADTRIRVTTGPAAAASEEAFASALLEIVQRVRAHPAAASVTSIGIGAAGPVNLPAGTISPINLPAVRDFEIVRRVQEATGIDDVRLRLDGTCIALSELWLGAAAGVRNAIIFVVSTGIGGGIVADGRVLAGASGNAGHLGQVVIDAPVDGDIFGATVEGQASGKYTVAWARGHGWPGTSGEELAAAYERGEAIAAEAIERSASALGRGLASVANLLNTELAVMGGGFSYVTDDYPDRVEQIARAHSVNAYGRELCVVRAGLGKDAPLVGAAAQILRADLLSD